MNAKKSNKLHGIIGRLGDLGAIDEKFDVAVTTAITKLNVIVCNSYEDGQRAIEFLRNNRVGRATFVCMDKIQNLANQMHQPFSAPEHS